MTAKPIHSAGRKDFLRGIALLLLVISPLVSARSAGAPVPDDPGKWESWIASFEQSDRLHPPPRNAVLFIGSSTVVLWKSLARDFPGVPIINRGFGGCEISDINRYADRIIFPYAPQKIFFRAGSNDLHAGKLPVQVFADFKKLAERIRTELPGTEFYYIALAPSISREKEAEATKKLNELIRDYVSRMPRFKYIDAWAVTLDASGKLRAELFLPDKLHLNQHGYMILADQLRPYLKAAR